MSLALRLAERHGTGWRGFAIAARLPVSGMRMSEALPRLAALSGIPDTEIARSTPLWLGHDVEVFGSRFDRSRFTRLNLRICAECMQEDVVGRRAGERPEDAAYLRIEWMMAFIFGCTKHKRELISRCASCRERPKWAVGRIDHCHCGSSLLRQEAKDLPPDQLRLLIALEKRLLGEPTTDPLLAHMGDVSLADLVRLLRLLGDLAIFRRGSRSNTTSLEADDLGSVLVRGAEVLADLPRSFEQLLDDLLEDANSAPTSFDAAYGYALSRLMRSDHAFVDRLRPIFINHAHRNRVLWSQRVKSGADDHFLAIKVDGGAELTAEEAERYYAATGAEQEAWISRRQVLERLLGSESLVTRREAAKLIGLAKGVFGLFQEGGIVQPTWTKDAARIEYYYRAEIEALLAKLSGDAPEVSAIEEGHRSIHSEGQASFMSNLELVTAMLAGELRPVARLVGAVGLKSLLFSGPPARLHLGGIKAYFGLRPLESLELRTAGLLDTVQAGTRVLTPVASIYAFRDKYVLIREIMGATSLSRKDVREALKRARVRPLPSLPKMEVYQRSLIERVFKEVRGARRSKVSDSRRPARCELASG